MRIIPSTCKFCHKPINLEIDDSYVDLGDPFKLIPKAACNRCSDFYDKRRKLFDFVKRNCEWLVQGLIPKGDAMEETRKNLRDALCRYMRLLAEHRDQTCPDWDENILQTLMEHPELYQSVLGQILHLFREQVLL